MVQVNGEFGPKKVGVDTNQYLVNKNEDPKSQKKSIFEEKQSKLTHDKDGNMQVELNEVIITAKGSKPKFAQAGDIGKFENMQLPEIPLKRKVPTPEYYAENMSVKDLKKAAKAAVQNGDADTLKNIAQALGMKGSQKDARHFAQVFKEMSASAPQESYFAQHQRRAYRPEA